MDKVRRKCRTREGCWTCRARKKKCPGNGFPCQNCARLGLACERETRLVWEDDVRRDGMRKRGPRQVKQPLRKDDDDSVTKLTEIDKFKTKTDRHHAENATPVLEMGDEDVGRRPEPDQIGQFSRLSGYPYSLGATESLLLDHYIQKFSRTYPTNAGPTNPFLAVLLPLSMRSRAVLDALLALSGVQTWADGSFWMEEAMLSAKQRALRGCRVLLAKTISESQSRQETAALDTTTVPTIRSLLDTGDEDLLFIFASCVLLLLYEKLAGEGQEYWTPHLKFVAQLFPPSLIDQYRAEHGPTSPQAEAFQFLHNLFLYNDLVRSTSTGTPTLSDFYLHMQDSFSTVPLPTPIQRSSRFSFPRLIARIGVGDVTVTDTDIDEWDGRVDWFPSFTLGAAAPKISIQTPSMNCDPSNAAASPQDNNPGALVQLGDWNEQNIISELYRAAAYVYLHSQARKRRRNNTTSPESDQIYPTEVSRVGNLAAWAAQLIQHLPNGSIFENAILWPIGIVAKELTAHHIVERECILTRLQSLERRFEMKHFRRVQEVLLNFWMKADQGTVTDDDHHLAGPTADIVLFG